MTSFRSTCILTLVALCAASPRAGAATKTVNVTVQGGATGANKQGAGFGHLTGPAHVLTLNLNAPSGKQISKSEVTGNPLGLWRFIGDPANDVKSSNTKAATHKYQIIEAKGDFEDAGHSALFSGEIVSGGGVGVGVGGKSLEFEVAVAEVNLTAAGVDADKETPEDNAGNVIIGLVTEGDKKQVTVTTKSDADGTITVSATNGVKLCGTEDGTYVPALPARSYSGGAADMYTFWVQADDDTTGTITATFSPVNSTGSTAVDKMAVSRSDFSAAAFVDDMVILIGDTEEKDLKLKIKNTSAVERTLTWTFAHAGDPSISTTFPATGTETIAANTWVTAEAPLTLAATSGSGIETVTFTIDGPIDAMDVTDIGHVYAVKVAVKQVGFSGSGEHTLKKTGAANYDYDLQTFGDNGNTTIADPVWQDDDLDGTAEKNDPICYTHGSSPTFNSTFSLSESLPSSFSVEIRAKDASSGTLWAEVETEVDGSELVINEEADRPFTSKVFHGTWGILWEVRVEDGQWVEVGTSSHLTFITYGTPAGSAVTAKRVDWVTRECEGGETLDSTDIPRKMQQAVQAEGAGHFQGGDGLSNPWTLFDAGVEGPCVTYSALMELGLQMLGVPGGKTNNTSVTSHSVATTKWLGENVDFSVLRWFDEWGSSPWVNEGVCGVNTDDKGWLFYDVAGGSTFGAKKAHDVGAQFATEPTGFVENSWREPEPSHGPIMKDWFNLPLYSDGIRPPIEHYIKVKSPNGGQTHDIGDMVTITFFSAGMQGMDVEVYHRKQGTTTDVLIDTVTVAAAASEAGNFSKETSVTWDTTGVAAGDYSIGVVLKGQSSSRYFDWSDGTTELETP